MKILWSALLHRATIISVYLVWVLWGVIAYCEGWCLHMGYALLVVHARKEEEEDHRAGFFLSLRSQLKFKKYKLFGLNLAGRVQWFSFLSVFSLSVGYHQGNSVYKRPAMFFPKGSTPSWGNSREEVWLSWNSACMCVCVFCETFGRMCISVCILLCEWQLLNVQMIKLCLDIRRVRRHPWSSMIMAGMVQVTRRPNSTATERRRSLLASGQAVALQQFQRVLIGRAAAAIRLLRLVVAVASRRQQRMWLAWWLSLLAARLHHVQRWRPAMMHTSRWLIQRRADTSRHVTDDRTVSCSCTLVVSRWFFVHCYLLTLFLGNVYAYRNIHVVCAGYM